MLTRAIAPTRRLITCMQGELRDPTACGMFPRVHADAFTTEEEEHIVTVHPHSDTGNDAHNPLDSFTDREDILTLFRRILHSAQAGHLHLVAIKGNSGTGKTFLISYLLDRVCPLFPWQAGAMSFA